MFQQQTSIEMQSVLNSVKGTALGVAEYLTPVLKVIVVVLMLGMLYTVRMFKLIVSLVRNRNSVKQEY